MRPRGPRSGALIAVLTLGLLVGLAGVVWPKLVGGTGPDAGGDFEARLPVHRDLDVAGPVQLVFDGLNGSVSVETGAPGKLAVTAFRSARGTSPEDAGARLAAAPLTIRQETDRVIFSARSAGPFPWSPRSAGRVDYRIVAPEQSGLTVADGHGSVDASGLHRGVDLVGDDLAVSLTNVGGVSVTLERGAIAVDGAAGPVRLQAGTGAIQAQHLSGPSAELNADGGVSVAESEVAGRLAVTSKGTLVSLRRARGREIAVSARGGAVEVADATTEQGLRLDAGAGKVTAERVQAHPLAVTTSTGRVALTEVQGELVVTTAGATVSLDDATASSLAVSSGGGDVSLSGRLPTSGATSIDTGGGTLRLAIARESAFTLDADAGRGGVAVSPALLSGNDLRGGTTGTAINGGGPPVVLRTHDGALSITTR